MKYVVNHINNIQNYLTIFRDTVRCLGSYTCTVVFEAGNRVWLLHDWKIPWVAIFHLRQSMVCLFHNSYGIPGLAPLVNALFWERGDFHISFLGRDMSGNVWNRPSGSSMVDMGVSSNIMKPSPKCYLTFWDMIIYSNTLHWSDISFKVSDVQMGNFFYAW